MTYTDNGVNSNQLDFRMNLAALLGIDYCRILVADFTSTGLKRASSIKATFSVINVVGSSGQDVATNFISDLQKNTETYVNGGFVSPSASYVAKPVNNGKSEIL